MVKQNLSAIKKSLLKTKAVKLDQSADCLFVHRPFAGGDVQSWIQEGINGYKQWYQYVDFGDGIVAHVTRPPDWKAAPEFDESSGLERWKLNIKKNLPDLEGKKVLDLGCNVGLYTLEMARMGAAKVVGVDRDVYVSHRTGGLPKQDIVSQANFVKEAFSLVNGESLPVEYLGLDTCNLRSVASLGKFDVVLALNIVYHTLDLMPSLLQTLSAMTDYLVLQASQGHTGPVGKWASLITHIEILSKLGFTRILIDSPLNNLQPVVVATR